MSLTNTVWTNTSRLGNVKENWLVHLYYDGSTSTFLPLATHDTTVGGVKYHGIVKKTGAIREAIDLASSKALSNNASIELMNSNYHGVPISQLFVFGTNNYINNLVKIYSQLNDESTLANCLQIYNGRLIDVSHDHHSIKMQLVEQRPWDFIEIPNTKTTAGLVDIPVSYGDFTKSTYSDFASPQYLSALAKTYRPIPLNSTLFNKMRFVNGAQSESTNGRIAYYDKNLDTLLPITSADTASTTEDGAEILAGDVTLKRGFYIRPTNSTEVSTDGSLTVADVAKAYNTDTNDYMSLSINVSDVDNAYTHVERFELETPTGDFSDGDVYMSYEVVWTGASGDLTDISITLSSGFGSISDPNIIAAKAKATQSAAMTANSGFATLTVTFTAGDTAPPNYGDLNAEVRIYDVYFALEELEGDDTLKTVYTGGDGFTFDITGGGSAAITEIHEAHLDMLNRYAGFDVATNPATDITNWTALNTDKNWGIRYWLLKPTSLKSVLERLQYEGGFIFKWRADGSGSYWYIKDSYSSADATLLDTDIDDLEWGLTPFNELITKMNINYEKHPAESGYIKAVTSVNVTTRSAYNIQSLENVAEVNLDAYVSPVIPTTPAANPNDDFYSYYDNISGNVKLSGSFTLKTRKYFNLESGDIVLYGGNKLPYAKTTANMTSIYFMITSVRRSIGSMKIEMRQVS